MSSKILFVDDESNVLSAFQRQFRKQYKVSTAESGAAALELIENEGPFAVIISDMQMPNMNGVEFLKKAMEVAPDTVRLMLTGNADQKTAQDAVNDGCVFRFLTKPCPFIILSMAIEAAVEQYRLITAEKVILKGTLNGTIKLLTDILSMVAPEAFGRAINQRTMARAVAKSLGLNNTWAIELAAMLANIGTVTLPTETIDKINTGSELTPGEARIVKELPKVSSDLLANIPRLEQVARIVLYQNKNFCGTGFPRDDIKDNDIPIESRILKVIGDIKNLEMKGLSNDEAIDQMMEEIDHYDPHILKVAANLQASGNKMVELGPTEEITITGLQPGQVLMSNVETENGRLIMTTGHELTPAIIQRLQNYSVVARIKEPIQVATPIE